MTRARILVGGYAVVFAWLAAAVVRGVVAPSQGLGEVFNRFSHDAVLVVACCLAVARVVVSRGERVAWGFVAAGVIAWTAGEIYYTSALWTVKVVPIPSPADAGYLLMPPLVLAGMSMLIRTRLSGVPTALVIDGLVAALTIGAVSAALVFGAVAHAASGKMVSDAVALAYPILDLVLLSVLVGALAGQGWRFDRSWATLASGVILFWVADSIYLVQTAHDAFVSDTIVDTAWWFGLALISVATWIAPSEPQPVAVRLRLIVMPLSFASIALGLLVFGNVQPVNWLATTLAALALGATMLRLLVSFRTNAQMLDRSQTEAMTDALTGLPNRRALARDLASRTSGRVIVLALFDLDGFKLYNDTFGHPAGDALLQRVAGALSTYLQARGTAYRMGGDEFCALLEPGEDVVEPLLRGAAEALSEHGEGFTITSSYGAVTLPLEADNAHQAMRIADQRMYARKNASRASAGRQSTDVLMRALAERSPELSAHLKSVTELSVQIARELALSDDQVAQVRLSAELHDIGKVAVPDEILHKPGPLSAREWDFIHGHTLIGERIVAAAPALRHLAPIVRATHERWDGSGYPDGLSGRDIPLPARIIAAAEAYDAMTHDLPYRARKTRTAANTELTRCAGTQFDPVIITALITTTRTPWQAAQT